MDWKEKVKPIVTFTIRKKLKSRLFLLTALIRRKREEAMRKRALKKANRKFKG